MTINGENATRTRVGRTHRDKKVHDYGVDYADCNEPFESEPVFEMRRGHACYIMFHCHNELCAFE